MKMETITIISVSGMLLSVFVGGFLARYNELFLIIIPVGVLVFTIFGMECLDKEFERIRNLED